MIELTPEQVTPAIRNLFPRSGHTWRRPLSALDGTGGGLILTDDPTAPSWAATADVCDDGTVFMAGALDREIVASIFEACRSKRPVTICLAADDSLVDLLPPIRTTTAGTSTSKIATLQSIWNASSQCRTAFDSPASMRS